MCPDKKTNVQNAAVQWYCSICNALVVKDVLFEFYHLMKHNIGKQVWTLLLFMS